MNPNGTSILYIDKIPYTINQAYPTFTNQSGYNSIGIDPLGHGLQGNMDEFRLYNRVITSSEISKLFDNKYSQ
jgi:hypothetical protein